jgi:hypothetical protein
MHPSGKRLETEGTRHTSVSYPFPSPAADRIPYSVVLVERAKYHVHPSTACPIIAAFRTLMRLKYKASKFIGGHSTSQEL